MNSDDPRTEPNGDELSASGAERRFVGLLEAAELMGGFSWLEREMFGVLGAWSATEGDPTDAVMLADHARRSIWHSQLWFDRIPELSNVDAESLVRVPSIAVADLMADLGGLTGTVERLVGGYRVMCTHLLSTYDAFGESIDSVSAPSVHRWLAFITSDLVEQWKWGERRLRELLDSPESVTSALDIQRELELRLLRGPGTING